jgi:hypothetical protein
MTYFKLKKEIVFGVRFQKKPPVWHFTATYIGAHNVLPTFWLFSQQKQKEFQLTFLPDEYSKVYLFLTTLSTLNSEIKSCHRTLCLKMPAVKVWIKNTSNILKFSHLFHPLFKF